MKTTKMIKMGNTLCSKFDRLDSFKISILFKYTYS